MPRIMCGNNNGAEQSLENFESCCLAELFLPNIETEEELHDCIYLLYRVCKHSLLLPSHQEETQEVVHRNMRMGIGVTGYLQASEEQKSWLSDAYEFLRDLDKEYSEMNDFNPSIKLTTVKPSGTLSLLPGVTPGVHPGIARFMYRRITIAADNPLVEVCKSHGYPVEYQLNLDGTENFGTVIVTFPYSYPEDTVLEEDLTAIDQLEYVKELQSNWSDNSVSCTVYYKEEEIPGIQAYLRENYKTTFKSLSFLLAKDHGFLQAPYEAITEEQFNDLTSKTTLITSIIEQADFEGADECASGACPVR